MAKLTVNDEEKAPNADGASSGQARTAPNSVSDDSARRALEEGDSEKIDRTLEELNVSTTESGKDQSAKPDTEGSNSSSKNLDEQSD
ncbi:hypothetical protein SAMN05443245_7336 [Paraburkholderia fungorum]|uniref:Uncharacterized protein n=1 Tax=Paraburkholderia fungorum TaxID=134537 RepID=A0A1H1JVG6_9BURK|nr:hypothetical protein [Paraburkholderia fungorum]SDR54033.1 hypothetical protein SAMN05443245_7336 [Paraburkholderia fungorum]